MSDLLSGRHAEAGFLSSEKTASVPLLEVKDLHVSFKTERGIVEAVNGVSFSVQEREILGLVGESGSGKSVTLMSVLGLNRGPNTVIKGSVRFRGQELTTLSENKLRKFRGGKIAMIFQDPMTALTPVYTIGTQIVEQLRIHTDLTRKQAKERAVELLAAVGMPAPRNVAARYPHQLSGGMRQRGVIAMALSCSPDLLLADEPTTALDVTVQAQILDLLYKLRDEFNSSIIIVTHNMGVVAETSDNIMVMYGGKIAEYATTRDIFAAPQHPYSWGLLRSIPPLDGEKLARLPSIPGLPPSLLHLPPGCAFAPRCRFASDRCKTSFPVQNLNGHLLNCTLNAEQREKFRGSVLMASPTDKTSDIREASI